METIEIKMEIPRAFVKCKFLWGALNSETNKVYSKLEWEFLNYKRRISLLLAIQSGEKLFEWLTKRWRVHDSFKGELFFCHSSKEMNRNESENFPRVSIRGLSSRIFSLNDRFACFKLSDCLLPLDWSYSRNSSLKYLTKLLAFLFS